MGLFDGLSDVLGGQAGNVVESVLSAHGGVAGLVQQLQQGGLGDAVQSWIGEGGNLPVSAEQIMQALDPDTLAHLASQHGLSVESPCQQLAAHLPKAIGHLTPDGPAPDSDDTMTGSDDN